MIYNSIAIGSVERPRLNHQYDVRAANIIKMIYYKEVLVRGLFISMSCANILAWSCHGETAGSREEVVERVRGLAYELRYIPGDFSVQKNCACK